MNIFVNKVILNHHKKSIAYFRAGTHRPCPFKTNFYHEMATWYKVSMVWSADSHDGPTQNSKFTTFIPPLAGYYTIPRNCQRGHGKSAGNCSLSISWYTPYIVAENREKVIKFEVFQQGHGGISLIFSHEGDITTSKVKELCLTRRWSSTHPPFLRNR